MDSTDLQDLIDAKFPAVKVEKQNINLEQKKLQEVAVIEEKINTAKLEEAHRQRLLSKQESAIEQDKVILAKCEEKLHKKTNVRTLSKE